MGVALRCLPLRVATAMRVVVLICILGGCATVAPYTPGNASEASIGEPFEVKGRISARRGSDGLAANFSWSHTAGSDRMDLSSPLGQVIARIEGDAVRVHVDRGNGQRADYPDWNALTVAVFGVTIPVDPLSWWIRGVPRSGAPFGAERDDRGRLVTLRQQGWEIVYAYRDGTTVTRPYRLVIRSADAEPIDVRVVIDEWLD